MTQPMIGLRVIITRCVGDEPQPGVVECEFSDAHGHRWTFVEKTAIVSAEYLNTPTSYPRPGVIACEIVLRTKDATGREIVLVDTEQPSGVESADGTTRFEVLPNALVEWERSSKVQRVWNSSAEPS
jgi:hypothetical protein